MRKVFKIIGLSICLLFVLLGIIGLALGSKESLLMLIIGVFFPFYYYGFQKEGSLGYRVIFKFTSSLYGKVIMGILFLLFIILRLFLAR